MAGDFEQQLEVHERERHRGILSRLPLRRPLVDRGADGFLEPSAAAAVMRVTVTELWTMVARGELSTLDIGDDVLVRPAIVSTLHVRTVA